MCRVQMHLLLFVLSYLWQYIDCNGQNNGYIVDTEKCKIPFYEPFNNETTKLWFRETYRRCTDKPLLTRVKKQHDKAILYIEEHLVPLYGFNVSCCVSKILRVLDKDFPDDKIRTTKCEPFEKEVGLNTSAIMVFCQDELGHEVYRNTHFIIKNNITTQIKTPRNSSSMKPLSVLFIVIDSISRMNFFRTMPKTENYLIDNDFVEMKGYNKIDDNTFPNFLALLTGLNMRQLRKIHCMGNRVDELDNCPMIWKNFSTAGYITAYGEDWGSLNTFNFAKKGFSKPPTQFYFRPYVLASEALGTKDFRGAPFCAGPETSGERQLNLALDFSKTFKDSPYFGIFWMNTFSHQSLNDPTRFDDKMREFFINLKADGILDDSMVILLSDHGIRMDKSIRRTLSGWFEERLPINLISVPKWFREKYPSMMKNLKSNSEKLTSTYDLYMTLQHLLKLSSPNYEIYPSRACPNCYSFFDPIPRRSCSEAGITEEWCTCIGHLNHLSPSDTIAINGAKFVLQHIKSELNFNNQSHACSDLRISLIEKAALSETAETYGDKYLILHFFTNPKAEFIVALKYSSAERKQTTRFTILFDIIRLDYGNSRCRPYSKISKYCNCSPLNNE